MITLIIQVASLHKNTMCNNYYNVASYASLNAIPWYEKNTLLLLIWLAGIMKLHVNLTSQ